MKTAAWAAGKPYVTIAAGQGAGAAAVAFTH